MDHEATPSASANYVGVQTTGVMPQDPAIKRGPGVTNVADMPSSRLDEPGRGLEEVPHRVLAYADLRSLAPNADVRPPQREITIHLTGNMERYMWSFNGVTFSEVTEPIVFRQGERVRMTLVNNTMMNHPIHLHGMFFDLVNGGGTHKPRKHTVIVKPGEKLSVDISADHVGDWAFHCHLLYHMHAGMMQVVSVLPDQKAHGAMDHSNRDHGARGQNTMETVRSRTVPEAGDAKHGHHTVRGGME